MKVLSLFDGISCARVALERAGIKIEKYYASEIDKYAIQIAQKNYPDTIQLGDIKGFDNEFLAIRQLTGNIDLIVGGSPCQDLSIAKKDRKGLDGSRSGLFWEYVRILKEVKPKYFILENVASMPKEAKQIITETLGVEPIMINAALVSAQNRKRLFWTNIPNVIQPKDRGILLKDILEDGDTDRLKSYCIDANYFKGGSLKNYLEKSRRQIVLKQSESRLYRIGQIGKGGQGDRIYSPNGKSVNLSANGGGRGAKTGLYAVSIRGRNIVNGKRKDTLGAKTKQRLEVGKPEKSHAITSVQKDSLIMENYQVRKLTPIECERLQSLPDDYTSGISNSQRYKCLGNAFNVEVVKHILTFIPK